MSTVKPIIFNNQKAFLCTFIDITVRKYAEDALRESEKKFRELVKYAPTAIYELDFVNRKFTTVNDAMCSLSGYSREELLSLDALDF